MSETKTLFGREAVLEGMASHSAVHAILAWNAGAN
jgi:hypothetical protein